MRIERFEELEVWKESRKLVKMVYDTVADSVKLKKDFRLSTQLTSASVSIMSNIAEGFSRHSNKEFIQFLYISKASASEVQSILYVILDLGYTNNCAFNMIYEQSDKVAKMNSNLIKYLSKTLRQ